ncbi:hypothetical protein DEU45_13824 [Bacillus sp. AG102]|nr:hypothetical protein DEU45_13824 [Bacillus sp. AG102]TWE58484.1 hypothetical protein FHW38_1321 [Bacillus thuringiensis]
MGKRYPIFHSRRGIYTYFCKFNFVSLMAMLPCPYRSLYSCFSRNSRNWKETNNNRKYTSIIGHVLFLFGKSSVFVHVMGNTRYFPTSLFDSNCRNYDHAIKKKLVCTANAYASKTAGRSNK